VSLWPEFDPGASHYETELGRSVNWLEDATFVSVHSVPQTRISVLSYSGWVRLPCSRGFLWFTSLPPGTATWWHASLRGYIELNLFVYFIINELRAAESFLRNWRWR